MKKLNVLFLIAFFVGALASCNNQSAKVKLLQHKMDSIKLVYAPDKRTAIFDLSIENENGQWMVKGETNLPKAKAALIEAFNEEQIVFTENVKILPDTTVKQPFGIISLSVANIRSMPGHSQELVSQALLGTPVKVIKTKGYWSLIQTPDNYLGWLDGTALFEMTKKEFNHWQKGKKIVYTNHAGFVWDNKKRDKSISDITAGSFLNLVDEEKEGFTVVFPDGREGFVKKDEAMHFEAWMNQHDYTSKSILNTAFKFLGHPYLWGGTSTKGVDCSGFTKTVYFLNGMVLQRDASQQELYGEEVSTENNFEQLKPGDLLFFGRAKTDSTTKRITHVGIYAGNLEFIHAAGRVFYDSFNPEAENYNEYRKKSLVSVKRYLNSINTQGIEKITDNSFYKPQQ